MTQTQSATSPQTQWIKPFDVKWTNTEALWNKKTSDNILIKPFEKTAYVVAAFVVGILETLKAAGCYAMNGGIWVMNKAHESFGEKKEEKQISQPQVTAQPTSCLPPAASSSSSSSSAVEPQPQAQPQPQVQLQVPAATAAAAAAPAPAAPQTAPRKSACTGLQDRCVALGQGIKNKTTSYMAKAAPYYNQAKANATHYGNKALTWMKSWAPASKAHTA